MSARGGRQLGQESVRVGGGSRLGRVGPSRAGGACGDTWSGAYGLVSWLDFEFR
jgi:hypothetical protein